MNAAADCSYRHDFVGAWNSLFKLPKGFAAEPRVHLGTYFEIDVCTFDKNGERDRHSDPDPVTSGGVATATLAPPAPTLTVDVDFPDQYVYEALIFDQTRDRKLVAAVEIVSPAKGPCGDSPTVDREVRKLAAKRRLRLRRFRGDRVDQAAAVGIIADDLLPSITPRHHVINRFLEFDPQSSWHSRTQDIGRVVVKPKTKNQG